MSFVLDDIPYVVYYLDDIICYSDSWEEHLLILEAVSGELENANLVLNLSKCVFAQAKVQFLGHMVDLGSLSPPTAKVEAITEMEAPRTKRQLRRFLGAIGYYHRYIKKFC